MKNVLKAIWKKKYAWFVLIVGILNLFNKNYAVGGALVSCSIPMFFED